MNTISFTLALLFGIAAAQQSAFGNSKNEVEFCEKRPKYNMLALDELLPELVEFIYRTSCNTTDVNPFAQSTECLSELLDDPIYQGKWSIDKSSMPRAIALKKSLCRYTEAADKCHTNAVDAAKKFTCTPAFAKEAAEATKNFLAAKTQLLCGGTGTSMQLFAAVDGDGCVSKWRSSLVECMYHTLAPLRAASLKNANKANVTQNSNVICRAFDLMRSCSFNKLSRCSTTTPLGTVDFLMREYSKRFKCPNGQRPYSENMINTPTATSKSP